MDQKFPYILRISQKAKHVRFQVSVEKGLEIVVPKRFSASRVPSLIEKNRQWIERAFQKAKAFQGVGGSAVDWQLPEQIALLALGQKWTVLTFRDDLKPVLVREMPATTLVVQGSIDDAAAWPTALKKWLTQRAKEHLIPWLKRVSDETGLRYSSVSIRRQQTRWGSCSARGSISLNAGLLFLPPELVTYVLVHELCHTKQLNHSPRFWRLVEYYLPDYRQFDRQLRNAGRSVPGWLTASYPPTASAPALSGRFDLGVIGHRAPGFSPNPPCPRRRRRPGGRLRIGADRKNGRKRGKVSGFLSARLTG
jgi:predicted metal-dependent hydrolase